LVSSDIRETRQYRELSSVAKICQWVKANWSCESHRFASGLLSRFSTLIIRCR